MVIRFLSRAEQEGIFPLATAYDGRWAVLVVGHGKSESWDSQEGVEV